MDTLGQSDLTMNVQLLKKEVERAAKSVAFQWPGVLDAEDAEQAIYLRLLETPGSVEKILEMDAKAKYRAVVGIGHQLAKKERTDYNYFKGSFKYCVDDVKGLLRSGILVNPPRRFNSDGQDLLHGLAVLQHRTPAYVDAIRSRYVDGLVPVDKSGENALRRGLTALTAEMNQSNKRSFSERDDGPGTRKPVRAEQARWESKGSWDDESPEAVARLVTQARVSGR